MNLPDVQTGKIMVNIAVANTPMPNTVRPPNLLASQPPGILPNQYNYVKYINQYKCNKPNKYPPKKAANMIPSVNESQLN